MNYSFRKPRFYSPLRIPQPRFVGLRDSAGRHILSCDATEYMPAYMKALNELIGSRKTKDGSKNEPEGD